MLGVIRDSAASIQEQSIQSIQEESSQIQAPPSPNLDQQQQQQTELPKTELPPKRPAFKAKLNNYLRNSISLFKKTSKNPAVTQILTTLADPKKSYFCVLLIHAVGVSFELSQNRHHRDTRAYE